MSKRAVNGNGKSKAKVNGNGNGHHYKAEGPLLLPGDRLERVEAWGMATSSMAHVYRPSTLEHLSQVFEIAHRSGRTVAVKGGGNSYGDPFQNREEIVLDTTRMTRVLAWNPEEGIIDLEPGVTIEQLWRYVIGDGWWPPVVSGTMKTTMGGCAGMNIHGKNAWKKGPFGDHILEFDLMTPDGSIQTVTRESNNDLFRGAISGFGMMGVMTRIRLKLTRIHSGDIEVYPHRVRNFQEMGDAFEENADKLDYMVGWNDLFSSAEGAEGRGELHFARQLNKGEDARSSQSLRLKHQEIGDLLMGFMPKSVMWIGFWCLSNNLGMRALNTAKYFAQLKPGSGKAYMQSHAAFHFLLDYVPNWKWGYKSGSLIQYQSFVPKENAVTVFNQIVKRCKKRGLYSYLGVTKKHRPDDYLMTHAVDGYSLAMDFPVLRGREKDLWRLCHELDELVLDHGGRFYFAKDLTMREGTPARYLPEGNVELFHKLKKQCDPEGMLTSNLYRRVFGLLSKHDTVDLSKQRRKATVR